MGTSLKFSYLLSAKIKFSQVTLWLYFCLTSVQRHVAVWPDTNCTLCLNNAGRSGAFSFISHVASVFLLIVRQVVLLFDKAWGPPKSRPFGDGERRCSECRPLARRYTRSHKNGYRATLRSSPSRWQTRPATDLDRLPPKYFHLHHQNDNSLAVSVYLGVSTNTDYFLSRREEERTTDAPEDLFLYARHRFIPKENVCILKYYEGDIYKIYSKSLFTRRVYTWEDIYGSQDVW